MSTIDEALARGLAHHRAGDLRAAEQIYRQVLSDHPTHAEALHRLGALALQTAHAADAVRLIEQAIAIDPSIAEYHNNLGSAYLTVGRNDEARLQCEEAIRLDPTMPDAHYNMGLALYALGRLEEAAASYRLSLRLRPMMSVEPQRSTPAATARALCLSGSNSPFTHQCHFFTSILLSL